MDSLLSRFAANLFWFARYMERAENLARLIDVNETYNRGSDGDNDWQRIIWLHSDQQAFAAKFEEATEAAVLQFYITDRDNPNSIIASVGYARENARSLRHLISTEMWQQINVFYNRLRQIRAADLRQLSALCSEIKEGCQTHTGITEGTFFRNQGWFFYHIGKYLERADQTTRLLDMRHELLAGARSTLPAGGATPAASQVDLIQLSALLRSVAGYHAFRQVHQTGLEPGDVLAFLLFEARFARSVTFSASCVADLVGTLEKTHRLDVSKALHDALTTLRFLLDTTSTANMEPSDLHDYLDRLQIGIGDVSDAVSTAYFGT